jgi:DNA modification methylase
LCNPWGSLHLVLKCRDFRKVGNEVKDNSIDLIFTDPPYITDDSIDLYESLAIMGKRVLKEGWSCLCYVTQTSLYEVLKVMSPYLKYWWIISLKHGGNNGRHGRGIFVEWKPILWFVKGNSRFSIDFVSDYIKSDPPEKILHPWEQSTKEAEYYIDYLTPANGIVLDVMMGSGTTGVSALKLGRDFIGIEKDKETFEIAKRRIWETVEKL